MLKNKRKKITVATTISGNGLVKAGGSNVVHGLYTCLAQYFDIEIIYIGPENGKYETYEIVPGLKETVIPKTHQHMVKEWELREKLKAKTVYDVGLMYYLEETPEYGDALRNSIETSDFVFIERPYLFHEVRKYVNGRPMFQRSQNIEVYFRKSNIPDGEERNKVLKDLFQTEKSCCNFCTANFACSEIDLQTMGRMYGVPDSKLWFLPNGVNCNESEYVSVQKREKTKKSYGLGNEKIAVFIGGGHRPNVEAAETILRIAPFCVSTKFVFVGDVCRELMNEKKEDNVILLGLVSEKTKKFLFSVSDMALNPMYSGSGSNIKMFDYMASGLPIVTTLFGARGISDTSTFHIADTEEEIIFAINSFGLQEEQENVSKARHLVETHYDWKVLAERVKEFILQYS